MNESFKTDPSLATSARAANESGSYLCASNVTPTAVRFIVSVFLCLLCSCRMSSTQMTCSHFRKNRPKKRQKPAGCRSRIISKNRPVPIFGRSTGASLITTSWLRRRRIRVLKWPACSPALSPIENIWRIIKRKMRQRRPKTVEQLEACIRQEWDNIPIPKLEQLVSSVPRRLQTVIKRRGDATQW